MSAPHPIEDAWNQPLKVGDRVAHLTTNPYPMLIERWIVEVDIDREKFRQGRIKLDNPNKRLQRWCCEHNVLKQPPMPFYE